MRQVQRIRGRTRQPDRPPHRLRKPNRRRGRHRIPRRLRGDSLIQLHTPAAKDRHPARQCGHQVLHHRGVLLLSPGIPGKPEFRRRTARLEQNREQTPHLELPRHIHEVLPPAPELERPRKGYQVLQKGQRNQHIRTGLLQRLKGTGRTRRPADIRGQQAPLEPGPRNKGTRR